MPFQQFCYLPIFHLPMKRILFVAWLMVTFPVIASHIVGGEFEMIHISGNTYRINLILYFDKVNGAAGAKDQLVQAQIYRKRDRILMREVNLPLTQEAGVPYTQPECSRAELETDRLVYTTTVELPPGTYNDAGGYYIVWQRCCRNYSITNIVSQNPQAGGIGAGQTFYLEFPPVVSNGEPFINSSPRLFPPLSDFGCPFRPYYVDFAGVDDDNDSLVYSMITPLNTTSASALPTPSPGPYPDVIWRPGFGPTNIINGQPDMRISTDGLLTCTPQQVGLFVFAVKVEEYRSGKKIGESRRDFQLLVDEFCPLSEPPKIMGKKQGETAFTFDNAMSVLFPANTPDDERCIQVRVSDPDASRAEENFQEKISLRVVALNFRNRNLNNLISPSGIHVLQNGSTKDFTVCFPKCPFFEGGPYQIGIIAQDDACSLPLTDTLRVTVNVQIPPNQKPQFTPDITATITEGLDPVTWNWEAVDVDNDPMVISLLPGNFQLNNVGMSFFIDQQSAGLGSGRLVWDPKCNVYDFTGQNYFEVKVLSDDLDLCGFNKPDTLTFKLTIDLPDNVDPIIDSDLTLAPDERKITDVERKINESLVFKVTGTDANQDFLVLDVKGKDFLLSDYGISFPPQQGNQRVTSSFQWDLRCANINLKKKSDFEFQFIVVDNSNKCRFYKADTLDVQVKILPPDNEKPQLQLLSSPSATSLSTSLTYELGQPIVFQLEGTDADNFPSPDLLKLALKKADGNVIPTGFSFSPVEGLGSVNSVFSWQPDCSVFENDTYTNEYEFLFTLDDDRCFNAKSDSLLVKVTLRDVDGSDTEFLPPNVITPNGDECNDYFALEDTDHSECGDARLVSLPRDNCLNAFEQVQIYNRWGNVVFESRQRDFKWYAPEEAGGVYYYLVKYTRQEYKGWLSVRY